MTKRADKKKTIAKVTTSLLNKPLQTAREMAKDTGLWASTVNRARKELAQEKRYQDLMKERDSRTRILSDDFKKEIDNELLARFIEFKGWREEAMKWLEEYIQLLLWDKEMERNISKTKRYEVLNKANFKCQACWAKPKADNNVILHIDHILPASVWWTVDIENLQVLCSECNRSKQNLYNINHNTDD